LSLEGADYRKARRDVVVSVSSHDAPRNEIAQFCTQAATERYPKTALAHIAVVGELASSSERLRAQAK